jgi:hypothetical protein
MNLGRLSLVLISLVSILLGCAKYSDPKGKRDSRLDSTFYCNDPNAVNYNWGFPGTPDSALCYYPADIYKGNYSFTDSIYNGDGSLDSAQSLSTYTLSFIRLSNRKIGVLGFCSPGDTLFLTVSRVTVVAEVDTLVGIGQKFCRTQDTVNGYLTDNRFDTLTSIKIDFSVISDTGLNYHRGTAYKLP